MGTMKAFCLSLSEPKTSECIFELYSIWWL